MTAYKAYVNYVANWLEVLMEDIADDPNAPVKLIESGNQTVNLLKEYAQGMKH